MSLSSILSPLAGRSARNSSAPVRSGTADGGGTAPPESARTPEANRVDEEKASEELSCSPGFALEAIYEGEDEEEIKAVRVKLGTLSVTLRSPSRGTMQLDTGERGRGGRTATGTHDWQEAVRVAEGRLRAMLDDGSAGTAASGDERPESAEAADDADASEAGKARPAGRTLQECVDLYLEEEFEDLTQKEQKNTRLAIDLVQATWGLDTLAAAVDRKRVETFIEARTEEGIVFPKESGRRALAPVKHYTALENLRTFARITRYAASRKPDGGEFFLDEDPFERISWPRGPDYEKEHQEPIPMAVHKGLLSRWTNPRTGEERPAPVDRIDPTGLLRMLLLVLFFTGHRRDQVLDLRVGDLLFDVVSIRRRLLEVGGVHRAKWAALFAPHGAIYWRPDPDKESYARVIPISAVLRRLLEAYLKLLPSLDPEAPLFPSPQNPARPISASTLFKTRSLRTARSKKAREGRSKDTWKIRSGGWFTEAVFELRAQLALEGKDPGELIPLLIDDETGSVTLPWKAHGYRRRYATILERLGYNDKEDKDARSSLDRHGNFVGGWSILGGGIKEERYVDLDPAVLVAAVNLRPAHEVMKERADAQEKEVKEALAGILAASRAGLAAEGEGGGG